MSRERALAVLVAADVFLAFAVCGADAFFQWTLPGPLRDFAGWSGSGTARQFGMLWMWAVIAICAIVAWIGLVNYWWFARRLYLGAMAATLLLRLVSGPSVRTPFASTLSAAGWVVGGAILGLIYFSDLSRRFERNPAPVTDGAPARA
jgi:hypothetical protein